MYNVEYYEILINCFIWGSFFFVYGGASERGGRKESYLVFLFLVILYCVFGYSVGDFVHYYNGYQEAILTGYNSSWEPFYNWLFICLPENYYIWRFAIWGMAALLYVGIFKRLKIFKRLNIPVRLAAILFTIVLLYDFKVARVSLAYSLLLYSTTFITKPIRDKYFSYFIALSGFLISCFLHKSSFAFLIVLFFAFFDYRRTHYIVLLCIFPFLYGWLFDFVINILGSVNYELSSLKVGMRYLHGENFHTYNIFGYLQLCLQRIPILITILLCIEYQKKYVVNNLTARVLSQYSFLCFYLSCLFFNQETSSFLSSRILGMVPFSLVIVLPIVLMAVNNRAHRYLKLSILFIGSSALYSMLYSIYSVF